jgi:hypothetical protein
MSRPWRDATHVWLSNVVSRVRLASDHLPSVALEWKSHCQNNAVQCPNLNFLFQFHAISICCHITMSIFHFMVNRYIFKRNPRFRDSEDVHSRSARLHPVIASEPHNIYGTLDRPHFEGLSPLSSIWEVWSTTRPPDDQTVNYTGTPKPVPLKR